MSYSLTVDLGLPSKMALATASARAFALMGMRFDFVGRVIAAERNAVALIVAV